MQIKNNQNEIPMSSNSSFDCSKDSDTIKIDLLNRHLQSTRAELDFKYTPEGPAHCPTFFTTCFYEGVEFKINGPTKNDCKKRIKTAIWDYINKKENLKYFDPEEQLLSKIPNILKFSDFKQILYGVNISKPILIIDLENAGGIKPLQDMVFLNLCKKLECTLICVFARLFPDYCEDVILIKREDLHRDSADEGIRRIVYYLVDCLGAKNIELVTSDHFGQTLKDSIDESGLASLGLFLNVDELKMKKSGKQSESKKITLIGADSYAMI